ncbi:ABC transporter permease [Occultella aeris]|uniref:ABC transporter permease n=1 Tax=Occultella aeris TaxID=2761496 RepID=UPI0012E9CC50|nr:ABC transporter permease [Occultella aeris]
MSDLRTAEAPIRATPAPEHTSDGTGTGPAQPRGASLTRRVLARLAVVAVVLALWWLATNVIFADNAVVSRMGPWAAISELIRSLGDIATLNAITVSLGRLLAGLALSIVVAVPLGLLLGSNALLDYASAPVVQFLRMTSPLAWAPLVIVLLGSGTPAVIALVALATTWPVVLGTASGRRAIDPGMLDMVHSLGATRWEGIRTVVLPGLVSHLRTAVRVALGVGWVVLVPAEMFGVTNGLGYAILNARDNLDYEALAATMLLIGVVGFLLDSILRAVGADDEA